MTVMGTWRDRLLIVLFALALYLPGFWWGAPNATAPDRIRSWGVDDETPLGPLAEIHNIFQPKPDRSLGYPLMYSFVVAGAYTPYLGYLWLTGQFRNPGATYPFGIADPVTVLRVLSMIAHFVTVLMAAVIVLAAFETGRVLWDRRTGLLASLMVGTIFPLFYYARTGNVDVPVLCFTALALMVTAMVLRGGFTLRRSVWLGIFIGFTLATKEPSFASFIVLPPVILARHLRETLNNGWRTWAFWRAPLATVGAAFLAFGIGSGLFVDPQRYFAHVAFARQRISELLAGDVWFEPLYPYTWTGHLQLIERLSGFVVDSLTLPGVLLVLLGIFWVMRKDLPATTLALSALTYLAVLFWSARVAHLRYLLPAVMPLAIYAAYAVRTGLQSNHQAIRLGFAAATVVVVGLNLLRGIDLTYLMINDSRYAAAAWMQAHAQPGDRVDYFGDTENLPALDSSVVAVRAVPYSGAVRRPDVDPQSAQMIADRWREQKPAFVILIPDLSSPPGTPYNVTCPPQIYDDLMDGSLGYDLAASFETPALLPWIGRPALDYPSVNPPIRIFAAAAPLTRAQIPGQGRYFP